MSVKYTNISNVNVKAKASSPSQTIPQMPTLYYEVYPHLLPHRCWIELMRFPVKSFICGIHKLVGKPFSLEVFNSNDHTTVISNIIIIVSLQNLNKKITLNILNNFSIGPQLQMDRQSVWLKQNKWPKSFKRFYIFLNRSSVFVHTVQCTLYMSAINISIYNCELQSTLLLLISFISYLLG